MASDSTGVVRVITRLNIGGPARQALLLSRALRDEFPTTLVTGTAPADEGELTDREVPLTRIPLVRPVRPHHDVRAYLALTRILARQRPAIVHTHMAKAGMLARVASQRSRYRPRTVHTFHGHVLTGYFGSSLSQAFMALERRLAAQTDVLVAVSDETRDDLLRLGVGRPDQFRVIPLGVGLEPFLQVGQPSMRLRSRLGIGGDVPLVGVVGRLARIKDLPTLFRAVGRIDGCHLAVLGDGPDRAALEADAVKSGTAARIHFTGWWDDVPAAMADLDVIALSSRNEGTPVSLIEAAACSRPVVATDVGGVRNVVEDGVTGYLVPAGDDRALATRIRTLIGDSRLRSDMGAAGRTTVAPRFSADRLVSDMRALYRELVGANTPRRWVRPTYHAGVDQPGRPLVISFIGNCIETGAGLVPGTSYVDLVRSRIEARMPEHVNAQFRTIGPEDWSLLDVAVDDCIAAASDIVVIGTGTAYILGPLSHHRLAGVDRGTFSPARAAVKAIELRLANDSALLRAFGSLRALNRVLWVKGPPMSVPGFLEVLESAVTRLREAHCRVIVRGPSGVEVLTEGKDGKGLSQAVAGACKAMRVPYVIGESLIEKRPDPMVQGQGGRLNERGHEVLAGALGSLLEREVAASLSEPRSVIALPRRRSTALLS